MPASLRLVANTETGLRLSEAEIGNELTLGRPERCEILNDGDTVVDNVLVGVTGEHPEHVQLAAERDGGPGAWADPGREIIVAQRLTPGASAPFWARARFDVSDMEGVYDFELKFGGKSVGRP